MNARLEVEHLTKRFGKRQILKDISFSMEQGEVVGLLGPNGAGKTTSFYMVVGFLQPDTGTIEFDGHDLRGVPMFQRSRMGLAYLPQESSVFRRLSVAHNVACIIDSRKDLSKTEKKHLLEELLEDFRLTHLSKQPAYTLSGGERRRTEIARALAASPKILLLDEPFAGIDPIAVHDIKQTIKLLAEKNLGVLITDHNVRDTLEITDRAYVIHQGEIIVSGTRDDIIQNEDARTIYLGEEFRL